MQTIQVGAAPGSSGAQPTGVTNRSSSTSGSGANGSNSSGSSQDSLASSRGKDWGLPEESRNAVPIARPVVIDCQADKFVVHADGATSRVVKEIPMPGPTVNSINELVGAVSEQSATWGPAGRGMYWRPSLSVQVAPGGEGRFQDLQKLMADSGVDVQQAKAPAPKQVVKPKRWWGLLK